MSFNIERRRYRSLIDQIMEKRLLGGYTTASRAVTMSWEISHLLSVQQTQINKKKIIRIRHSEVRWGTLYISMHLSPGDYFILRLTNLSPSEFPIELEFVFVCLVVVAEKW